MSLSIIGYYLIRDQKCNMDRQSPETYIDASPEASIAATKELITYIRSLPPPHALVYPIITPRFAISCTRPLLTSLGALAAADPTLRIQTHISELPSEVALTNELFPECTTYARVYDSFGLLRSNTILGHGVHLEEEEYKLIAERGAGISHCPTSNLNLRSGVAKVGEWLDRGIKACFLVFRSYILRTIDYRLGLARTSRAVILPPS